MFGSEALTKALPLLHTLEERGFETVFVGGCVRDTLLGKPLKDVDIATAASPEQVIAAFPHTVPTGLQHGTVTVVHEGDTYEITTFRTESEYERFRRPAQVRFVTSLNEDLLRRDFTINSMAMRADGSLADPFGGRDDLRRGLLRCVGDADARLQEDALRIVRALRFAAAYDLRIAHGTWRAILRHRGLLAHIAMERIGLEFDKMIGGGKPCRSAALLAASGLLSFAKEKLPGGLVEAASTYAALSSAERRAGDLASGEPANVANAANAVAETLPSLADAIKLLHRLEATEDRWAALCAALALDAEEAAGLFATLRYSSARSTRLTAILGVHEAMAPEARRWTGAASDLAARSGQAGELSELHQRWRLTVLKHGQAAADNWLTVVGAIPSLILGVQPSAEGRRGFQAAIEALRDSLRTMPAATIKELAVKGKDLLALSGKASGPWLGQLLQALLEAVALGRTPNEKGPLLAEAEARLNGK